MNIRDLQYLVALAETRHFGQAATACHISQPTLSAQLKKLEEELGVVLLERTNKSVALTPVGAQIVAESQQLLQTVKRIKQLAASHKDPFAGPFQLGIIPTLGPYLLPYILPKLQQHFPKLELRVFEHKTEDILQALRAGKLDAALLALPVRAEGLQLETLFDEPLYVLLPKGHPLAKQHAITKQDMLRETLLLLEEGHCLREQALEACETTADQTASTYRATSLETLRQIVRLGAGITLMPALAVNPEMQQPGVVVKPLSGQIPARTIGLVWRQTAVKHRCIEQMAKVMREQTATIPALQAAGRIRPLKKPVG